MHTEPQHTRPVVNGKAAPVTQIVDYVPQSFEQNDYHVQMRVYVDYSTAQFHSDDQHQVRVAVRNWKGWLNRTGLCHREVMQRRDYAAMLQQQSAEIILETVQVWMLQPLDTEEAPAATDTTCYPELLLHEPNPSAVVDLSLLDALPATDSIQTLPRLCHTELNTLIMALGQWLRKEQERWLYEHMGVSVDQPVCVQIEWRP